MFGPTPVDHKKWREIDYGYQKVKGSSIEYNEETGDAKWNLHLHKLVPAKQFIHINALLQRPGYNDGPKSARGIDFSYKQEYTMFSTMGTQKHYISSHGDKGSNHSHHHKVVCEGGRRFCRPFTVFRKDYLPASSVSLQVVFYRPDLLWNGKPKSKKGDISQKVYPVPTAHPTHKPSSNPSSFPTIVPAPSFSAFPTALPSQSAMPSSITAAGARRLDYSPWSDKSGGSFPPTLAPTPPIPSSSPTYDFFTFNENATWTLILETVTVNKSYTTFELTFRYIFLAFTLVIMTRFLGKMSKLSYQMWGYQQKWIMILLAWLVLFDGPLQAARIYAVDDENLQDQHEPGNENGAQRNVYANRQMSRILTDFCMFASTSFIALLMIYFLSILEEMGSGRIWKYFGCSFCEVRLVSNAIKVVLVGSLWGITFVCYVLLRREQESDPSFSLYDDDQRRYLIPIIVSVGLYCVYLAWFLVLTCDACRAIRQLSPPFCFIALITFATAIIVIVGPFFGAWYTIPKSAASFAVFFGSVNIYIYALAFSYMPMLDGLALMNEDDDQERIIEMSDGFGKDGEDMIRQLEEEEEEEDDIGTMM